MIDQMNKLVEPLRRRAMLMIGRAILTAVKDDAKVQRVQASLLDGESREGMERMSEYGFTSVPLPGAQGLAVFVGGERGHGVIVATADARYRLTGLEDGEVAIYTDEGDKIVLKRGNLIEVTTDTLVVKAATKVRFETPLVESTGNQKTDGNIVADGDVADHGTKSMAAMRSVYNAHTHSDPQGGSVSTPNTGM